MEAFLISQIDNIDAKMYMYDKAESNLKPGEMTEKPVFDGIRVVKGWSKDA